MKFFLLILVIMLLSCQQSKVAVPVDLQVVEEETVEETQVQSEPGKRPQMLFLTCALVHDTISNKYSMSVVDKKIIDGKAKDFTISARINENGNFRFRILDYNSKVINQKTMLNPLEVSLEYADDFGNLKRSEMRLNSTEVFLRIPLTPDMSLIAFDLNNKELLLINLRE